MNLPAGNNDIDILEQNNLNMISVDVYSVFNHFDTDTIILNRRTKIVDVKFHINLLKIEDPNGNSESRYVYIKNYDKLLAARLMSVDINYILADIASMVLNLNPSWINILKGDV